MKIGIFKHGWWKEACEALSHDAVELPVASHPSGNPYAADLAGRIANGRNVAATLATAPVQLLVDNGGTGLGFVPNPDRDNDLKITHEVAGKVLCSHFIDPLVTVFQGLGWPAVWQCLKSQSWVKAVWDRAQVGELQRFGVPNVIHLPMAAPNRRYNTEPLDPVKAQFAVSFVGAQNTSYFTSNAAVPSGSLLAGTLTHAVRAGLPDVGFYETYHDLYGLGQPVDGTDDFETQAKKTLAYFNAKLFYNAGLCIRNRDRFVIFLKRMLGDKFQLVGRGWDGAYGLETAPAHPTADAYLDHFRETAVNINLVNGNAETGLNMRHFEITAAGGFMLCYDQPELAEHFEVGSECAVFRNEQDLLEKVRYYLGHPEERVAVAKAGQQRTLSQHLYSHRLSTLLEQVERLREGATGVPMLVEQKTKDRVQIVPATVEIPPTLLILQNPGRFTRYYLAQMEQAARRLGIRTLVYELSEAWQVPVERRSATTEQMEAMLRRENVRAVIGSGINGTTEWPSAARSDGTPTTLFDRFGIPHLLWWTEHPQWANEKLALREDLQPVLRGGCKHHFVKSDVQARELERLLGWRNCFALPVAEDPEFIRPLADARPEYDVVAIVGCPPRPVPELEPFLDQDEPDTEAIGTIVADLAQRNLLKLWQKDAPASMHDTLTALGCDWVERRRRDPRTAGFDHFQQLGDGHREAAQWLLDHYRTYFDAAEILSSFIGWQRTFVLTYLARHFRLAVFGSDWSHRGIPGEGWVHHRDQGRFYARGKVAINISQGSEEEGASHKPFQIAASGVAQVHIDRRGLSDYFEPGKEVELFETPSEARRIITELLADDDRRLALGADGRERLLRDHTWDVRLQQMFARAGIEWPTSPKAKQVEAPRASEAVACASP